MKAERPVRKLVHTYYMVHEDYIQGRSSNFELSSM